MEIHNIQFGIDRGDGVQLVGTWKRKEKKVRFLGLAGPGARWVGAEVLDEKYGYDSAKIHHYEKLLQIAFRDLAEDHSTFGFVLPKSVTEQESSGQVLKRLVDSIEQRG